MDFPRMAGIGGTMYKTRMARIQSYQLKTFYKHHSDWRRLQGVNARSRGTCIVADIVLSF